MIKKSRAVWYLNPTVQVKHTGGALHPKNPDVLKAEGLWSSLVDCTQRKTLVSCLRKGWEWNPPLCRLPASSLLLSALQFPSLKELLWSKGHYLGTAVPSDLFLVDNMLLKPMQLEPNNHIYLALYLYLLRVQSCSCKVTFGFGFLGNLGEGRKQ